MLEISQTFVDAIVAQSRQEYPDECCGVILGPEGSGQAQRLKPMINAAIKAHIKLLTLIPGISAAVKYTDNADDNHLTNEVIILFP